MALLKAALAVALLSLLPTQSLAADCKTATVGEPFATCWDIANAAQISVDQLVQFNMGLDCGKLQAQQKLCLTSGNLPANGPGPQPDGSCTTATVGHNDTCAIIGSRVGVTAAQIEQFNVNTYKFKGCQFIQENQKICVSPGTPPPIPINDKLQCGPESPSRGDCPLKACCSAFGFCGTTSEFCDAAPNGDPCISNCGYAKLPTCDGSQMKRKVGYYAGWAAKRTCDPVGVSQLDLEGYTHIIYAFAAIDASGNIAFDDATDGDRLKELVTKAAGKLKVMVAVGGWTFSEGSTKDRFSVMIGSPANRQKFISSAKAFIANYKIDGIDIDFEYPAAMERGGPPSDTPNLTAFFKELRAGLGQSTLSLATPAGYWFLRGFEMDKIAPNLDFINMMSYDYHGPWDTTVPGANSTALPQSGLQDMIDSAKLYVKAGVDLKMINLGLAWYGRSYKLQDSSCNGYGCDMTAGGTKGRCSGESGVLTGFEVLDLMVEGEHRPILDTASQTRWFTHNGDLITFDDDDTRNAKAKWAGETCFGGSMIWSIDQLLPKSGAVPGSGITIRKALNNQLGATWEEPKRDNNCYSYGTREWRARLWNIPGGYDWKKACMESPIEIIPGVRLDHPDECIDYGMFGGVVGVWRVSQANDDYCKPRWGDLGDDGCTSFGKHRYWSRLWDIPGGVSWGRMCITTPNDIGKQHFDTPEFCDDQSWYGGEIGVWFVDDPKCRGDWDGMKDNGCNGDKIGKRVWSSKLMNIPGSWEDACNNRDATVGDEYFEKPSRCEKHITGIWGVWDAQDLNCGVPPCPESKTWDYGTGACEKCNGKRSFDEALMLNATEAYNHASTISDDDEARFNVVARPVNATTEHSLSKRDKWCNPFHLPRPNPASFPQIPAAWAGQAAEGPSSLEIANSPTVQAIFQEVWNDSFNTPHTAQETGGWIYADPANPHRVYIRRAPRDRSSPMPQAHPPPNLPAGIDLWSPERASGRPPPAGFVLVANFHTHPMGEAYGGDASRPSTADQLNAWQRGVPGIIINRSGLIGYGPARRAQLNAPQGYPMSNEEWGGQGAGARLGTWRPNRAPNQQDD